MEKVIRIGVFAFLLEFCCVNFCYAKQQTAEVAVPLKTVFSPISKKTAKIDLKAVIFSRFIIIFVQIIIQIIIKSYAKSISSEKSYCILEVVSHNGWIKK